MVALCRSRIRPPQGKTLTQCTAIPPVQTPLLLQHHHGPFLITPALPRRATNEKRGLYSSSHFVNRMWTRPFHHTSFHNQENQHQPQQCTEDDDDLSSSFRIIQYKPSQGPSAKSAQIVTPTTDKTWTMQPYHPQTSTPTTKTPTVSSSSSTSENKDPNNLPKNSLSFTSLSHYLQTHILVHFLPARYPHSVAPGYAAFATASFAASVAGSAAMVLSTQTLLLAVGVVGASSSGVMAGALNWVLKDGIGQLGGVLFASLVGQFKSLDSHPKQWRVWSAASLDLANGMDICAPVVAATSGAVLPWACASNVLKNIGFLTTSASKAALHQTLASTGNLADITAKAGTQAMMAALLGTTVGIALSSTILQNDPTNFMMGFVGLSIVHQSCNYLSLRYVPLPYFNRQRLDILLHAYFLADESMHDTTNSQSTAANHPDTNTRHSPTILTPAQVALREEYFGHDRASASTSWLHLGSTVTDLAPSGVHDWQTVIQRAKTYNDKYVINVVTDPTNNGAAADDVWQVHVTFLEHASGMDLLRGVFHAHLIQQEHHKQQQHARNTNTNDNSLTKESTQSYNHEIIDQTRQAMGERNALFDTFLEDVQQAGWSTDTDVTTIEPYNAVRLSLSSRPRSE